MLLLRPRASFKSGQARLRNLIPYYSHRGSFQEEPRPTQLSSQERKHDKLPVVAAATFLEDPILFIEKNSCRGTVQRRRGVSDDESSCEERMDEDDDSLVEDDDSLVVSSLSDDTFSSEIFLELARTTSRDINANMRLVSDTTTVGQSCFAAAANPRSLVGSSQGSGLQSCCSSDCQQLGGGSSCHLGSAEGSVCSRSSSSSCFADEDYELVDGSSSSWGRTAER
jgi:hypothetical protein